MRKILIRSKMRWAKRPSFAKATEGRGRGDLDPVNDNVPGGLRIQAPRCFGFGWQVAPATGVCPDVKERTEPTRVVSHIIVGLARVFCGIFWNGGKEGWGPQNWPSGKDARALPTRVGV